MNSRPRGRPLGFERDRAVLEAARLFWRHGYSGTSTRALTTALGVSSSSLYAAFGSKAGLFEEAIRTYAGRYHRIYQDAVAQASVEDVIEHLLTASILEFTQDSADHPGCLAGSAALDDSADTLDASAYVDDLRRGDEDLLVARLEQAVREGEVAATIEVTTVAEHLQVLWHGLSARAVAGTGREELLQVARAARGSICAHLSV